MKKMFTLITLFVVVLVSSCSYDDTYVVNSIKDLQNRVSELEQLQNASDRGVLVESVTEIEGGYIVKFSDGSEIILYHGKDGADGKDGVDGEDGADGKDGVDGKDGADGKDGVDGKDGADGKDGVDGTSILEDIVITDEMVTFYLVDGSSFTFYFSSKQEPIGITFDIQSGVACKAGTSLEFGYAITGGYTDAEVECFGNGGWSADVIVASSASGTIKVVAPKDGGSGKVVVLVVSATGGSSMKSIRFDEGVIEDIVNLYEVGWEANTVEVEFRTNLEYDVRIPSEAQSWISVVDTRATMRDAAITLAIAENPAGNPDRSAVIELTSNTGDVISSFEISQKVQLVEELIVFADDNVKTVCVQKFDKNGDGEISMSEAAEVTTLGKKFFGDYSANVTSFDELKYFVNLNSISTSAFNGCTNLSSVTMPDSVTTIGDNAFWYCSSLTCVIIPDSVTSIENNTFSYCTSLTSVTIPDSVTSIGSSAFRDCSSLTSVTIPDSVTTIGNSAFYNCSSLTSVIIPDSVTSIGYSTFQYCYGLISVTIGKGVTMIGDYAFEECYNLTSVYISDLAAWCNIKFNRSYKTNPLYYAHNLYLNNELVRTITIPDNVTKIGDYVFAECTNLTSVTIPDSVTAIGNATFEKCNYLVNVDIGDGVTTIGSSAFANCKKLTSVTMSEGVTTIGNSAFDNCSGLTSVTIPDSVTTIGTSAFRDCSGLTSVTIPDSVTSIGGQAFSSCSSLMEVTIGAGVTTIGSQAFDYCTNLKSVYISDVAAWCSISFANESANPLYYNKANLYLNNELVVDLVVPDSVTAIGSYVFRSYANLTSVTIPDSVTTIGAYAFYGCSSLASLTIPGSVTSIGESAFIGCKSLTSVNIPGSVTTIDNWIFGSCVGLTELTIGEGVTSMNYAAFSGCSNLTSVTIPSSVTFIGCAVFGDCSNLTSVYCKAITPPATEAKSWTDWEAFTNNAADRKIYVPMESVEAYKVAAGWSDYVDDIVGYNF